MEYPTFYDDTVRRRLMDAEGYLWNPYGKTASSRRKVRLNSVAVEVIKRRMKAAKGLYLFPHKKTKNKPTLKVNNAHDRALEKSGVQPFRLYDLRHTWATRAAEAGTDIATLAALLGHSKLVMAQRYFHPGESHRIEAVESSKSSMRCAEEAEKRQAQEEWAHEWAQCPKIPQILKSRKPKVSRIESTKRRRSDSNRCIKVLQTYRPTPHQFQLI
jgi:hypothetical protein